MNLTPQKIQAFAIVPFWISVALAGFVAYHDPRMMKYFLVMNLLALAYTIIVSMSWVRRRLRD